MKPKPEPPTLPSDYYKSLEILKIKPEPCMQARVLEALIKLVMETHAPVTQVQLRDATGLSKSKVANAICKLMDLEDVFQAVPGSKTGHYIPNMARHATRT